MTQYNTIQNVKSGFKGAGIVPIDRNQVLKRLLKKKPTESTATDNNTGSANENHSLLINDFEIYIEEANEKKQQLLGKLRKKLM